MKTAELTFVIFFFFLNTLESAPRTPPFRDWWLIALTQNFSSSFDVSRSPTRFSTSVSKGDRQTANDSSHLRLKIPMYNKRKGKTIALNKESRTEYYHKEMKTQNGNFKRFTRYLSPAGPSFHLIHHRILSFWGSLLLITK